MREQEAKYFGGRLRRRVFCPCFRGIVQAWPLGLGAGRQLGKGVRGSGLFSALQKHACRRGIFRQLETARERLNFPGLSGKNTWASDALPRLCARVHSLLSFCCTGAWSFLDMWPEKRLKQFKQCPYSVLLRLSQTLAFQTMSYTAPSLQIPVRFPLRAFVFGSWNPLYS